MAGIAWSADWLLFRAIGVALDSHGVERQPWIIEQATGSIGSKTIGIMRFMRPHPPSGNSTVRLPFHTIGIGLQTRHHGQREADSEPPPRNPPCNLSRNLGNMSVCYWLRQVRVRQQRCCGRGTAGKCSIRTIVHNATLRGSRRELSRHTPNRLGAADCLGNAEERKIS